jgi:ribonucleoside-diphosphate reductase beta chain
MLPKPEIASVGITFWFNEVVHADFYSHLLELLWLNWEFEKIKDIPVLQARVDYLQECLASKNDWREWFVKALIFFTLFIENVSLFSQFLVMMSYKTKNNMLKWMYNWILASSKEEDLHQSFWAELINIIRKEYPELYTKELKDEVNDMVVKAMKTELKILDWIFEWWDLWWIYKYDVQEYVKHRCHKWLISIW